MSLSVNALDAAYMPPSIAAAVMARETDADLSGYLNDAAAAAGDGGEIWFPPGTYNAGEVATYARQRIRGSGVGTVIRQIGDAPIFAAWEWLHDASTVTPGRLLEDFAIETTDPLAGGYGIVALGYRARIRNVQCTGLPILLTTSTRNGTDHDHGQCSLQDIYSLFSPRGATVAKGGVTDVVLERSTINNCGAPGGAAAIDASTTAGWQVLAPKIFSCAGSVLRSQNLWNLLIEGGDIDWAGGDRYGLDLSVVLPKDQGLRLIGNNLRIKADDAGGAPYTMVSIEGRAPIHLTQIGNTYWVDTSSSGRKVVACALAGPSYAGSSLGNAYQGFSGAQLGNAEYLLGDASGDNVLRLEPLALEASRGVVFSID